jgi:hypothetical protein
VPPAGRDPKRERGLACHFGVRANTRLAAAKASCRLGLTEADLRTALEFTSDTQTRLKILKLIGNNRQRP